MQKCGASGLPGAGLVHGASFFPQVERQLAQQPERDRPGRSNCIPVSAFCILQQPACGRNRCCARGTGTLRHFRGLLPQGKLPDYHQQVLHGAPGAHVPHAFASCGGSRAPLQAVDSMEFVRNKGILTETILLIEV